MCVLLEMTMTKESEKGYETFEGPLDSLSAEMIFSSPDVFLAIISQSCLCPIPHDRMLPDGGLGLENG
jgi:hypothetical protein